VFEIIARYRPTIFFGVPTLYAAMLAVKEAEARFDTSSLRVCVSAGEALPEEIYTRWRERFGVEIIDGFTTEIGPSQLEPSQAPAWLGQVMLAELAIVDDEGRPAPRARRELRVRATDHGLWNHEKTRDALRP
jgi:benzoate-CoA ligase